MEAFWQDLRYALRALRKQPAFAVVIVLTAGLGVGANTAIFSLNNALLLRAPQGVTKPEEIVLVGRTSRGRDFDTFSYPDYADLRDQNASFVDLAAYRETDLNLTTGGSPEQVSGMLVSGNYFRTLGTHAEIGRMLVPEDDGAAGANPVALISQGLWQRRFGSDPNIAGKSINLNNFSFTILGVTEKGFTGTRVGQTIDVWLPLSMYAQADPIDEKRLEARHISWLSVVGWLKSGVALDRAQSEMTVLSRRLEQIYPDTDKGMGVALTRGLGLLPEKRDEARTRMGILLAVAGLVLLIVCANVANLLLAKGSARRKELALRQALGATRPRLIGQLLTEALVTSVIGGILGIILAFWSRGLLLNSNLVSGVRLSPEDLRFDLPVLGFALLVSLTTGFIFGFIPALKVSGRDLQLVLKDRSDRGPQATGFRNLLVVGQIALSVVVLICSGLFLRTLRNAESIQPGFDTDRILLMRIDPGRRGYSEEQGRAFYRQLVERVRTIPGVSEASLAITAPLSGSWRTGFRVEGQPTSEPDVPCDYSIVAPRYFETTGITLVSGRDFAEQDRPNSPRVVIVNEEFARRFFPQDNPLGKHLAIPRFKGDNSFSEIIGVARNIKYERLTELPRPYFYQPVSQQYESGAILLVRARNGDASGLTAAVVREAQALDANLPPYRVRTLGDRLRDSLAPQRSGATLLGVFGLLALALAAIGLYGVLAYAVGQRRQEFGVRMALGAKGSDVLKLVFRQGAILIIGGVAIGLLIALAVTHALTSLLYEVSAADPLTYAAVTAVLVITALIACYIPARRATKVDPLVALRYE